MNASGADSQPMIPYANPLPSETGNASLSFTGWTGTVTNFSGTTGQALAATVSSARSSNC